MKEILDECIFIKSIGYFTFGLCKIKNRVWEIYKFSNTTLVFNIFKYRFSITYLKSNIGCNIKCH